MDTQLSALYRCGTCAPQVFANQSTPPGIDGNIDCKQSLPILVDQRVKPVELTHVSVSVGLKTCSEANFPVSLSNTTSGSPSTAQQITRTEGNTPDVLTPSAAPDDANTSRTETLVSPTTRASGTGLGGLTGAPITTSLAPAQPTGATSQLHVASGLFSMAFSAGLYVLL